MITSFISNAQNEDFGIWTGVSANKKLIKKVKGTTKIQRRYIENARIHKSTFIQVGVKYKISKRFSGYGNYRFTYKPLSTANRFDFRLGHKKKVYKRTYLSSTIKSQYAKSSKDQYWDATLRFKWKIEHKVKKQKIYPYLANEWFYDPSGSGGQWDRVRLSFGSSFKTFKDQSFTFFYTRSIELNKNIPTVDNFLGAIYDIDF